MYYKVGSRRIPVPRRLLCSPVLSHSSAPLLSLAHLPISLQGLFASVCKLVSPSLSDSSAPLFHSHSSPPVPRLTLLSPCFPFLPCRSRSRACATSRPPTSGCRTPRATTAWPPGRASCSGEGHSFSGEAPNPKPSMTASPESECLYLRVKTLTTSSSHAQVRGTPSSNGAWTGPEP